MESVNPSDQYRKLEGLYAEMSDGRLREMAEEIDDLTGIAQEVLRAEISRRGLDQKPKTTAADRPMPAGDGFVGVWWAKNRADAESAVSALEDAGIPAGLGAEKFELVGGGFEEQLVVKVLPECRLRSMELLHQCFPQEPEPQDEASFAAICPNCKSPEIVFESLESQQTDGDAAKFNWSCDSCGHQWSDHGLEQSG